LKVKSLIFPKLAHFEFFAPLLYKGSRNVPMKWTFWEKGATTEHASFSDGFCPKTSKVEFVVTAAGHSAQKQRSFK